MMNRYAFSFWSFRRLRNSLLATLCLFMAGHVAADETTEQWTLVEENWYSMRMGDLGSGWLHQTLHHDQQAGHFRLSRKMTMAISRMGESGEITTESTFIETEAGEPVRMSSRQVMSQQPVYSEYVWRDGAVTHTSRQGGRETSRQVDAPEGTWLTPRAARQYIAKRIEAKAGEITFRTLDPDSGMTPVSVRSTSAGEDIHISNGREIPVTVWTTTTSLMPIQSTEHFTAEGVLVYQDTPTGIGRMVMKRATKDEALGQEFQGQPAMLPQTFITPDRPIENIMQARSATLRLRTKSGDLPEIPSAGAQRVTVDEDEPDMAILVIDIDNHLPASDEDLANSAYTTSSAMIDSDDAMVQALARRALREADLTSKDDPMDRADAMRRFVHSYITNPNLDVPFASASETARTRSGDCSEFGVLLAAMLRADGIPARTASGLVYADQFAGSDTIFGWHMWTQAIIDGTWVDLDATLPVRYHAGHVLTGTASLHEGQYAADMASMIILMGNLEIDVIDVGY